MLKMPTGYPPARKSWIKVVSELPESKREEMFRRIRGDEMPIVAEDWMLRARREQLPPPGNWFLWIILAGRGFGKNWTGGNVFIEAHRQGVAKNSAIIAATIGDMRKYCLEGPSGVLSLAPSSFCPKYLPSQAGGGVLRWPNGSITNLYSSEKPRRVRGANIDLAWCDEVSWWKYAQETWDALMFACRFGDPRIIVTMTPRPIPLVKDLVQQEDEKRVIVSRGSTYDNIDNLSSTYITEIIKPYEGTTLGRQELGGEILMDVDGALWSHAQIEELVCESPPEFDNIVIGVDPSTSSSGSECGIVAAGKVGDKGFVLGDHTLQGSPNQWGRKVASVYHIMKERGKACSVVAEKNQGGEMVSTILRDIEPEMNVRLVHASVGKVARAEPISALYEQKRIFHCGHFPKMEDEMCLMVPGEIKESPNRVDALVWAMTYLMLKAGGRARAWGRQAA